MQGPAVGISNASATSQLAVLNVIAVASEGLRNGAFFLKMLAVERFSDDRVAVELIETRSRTKRAWSRRSSTTAARLPHRVDDSARILEFRPHSGG